MPRTLDVLHNHRWFVTLAGGTMVGISVWFLVADWLILSAWGRRMLMDVHHVTGFWPTLDHTVKGLLGVYPHGMFGYTIYVAASIVAFAGSQVWFAQPRRMWSRSLTRGADDEKSPGRVWRHVFTPPTIIGGFLAGMMTTLWIVVAIDEWTGWWAQASQPAWWVGTRGRGVALSPQFPMAAAILIPAWIAWIGVIAWWSRGQDRFWRMVGLVFWLFIASSLTLLITGLLLISSTHFEGRFWAVGLFSAAGISYVIMIWTLGPATALIIASRPYFCWKTGSCLTCGYDLRGTLAMGSTACPECGESISPLMSGHVGDVKVA